jgi:hypothetical protein
VVCGAAGASPAHCRLLLELRGTAAIGCPADSKSRQFFNLEMMFLG